MRMTMLVLPVALGLATAALAQAPAKPAIAKACMNCHDVKADELRGVYENVAFKSKSIQLKIDEVPYILKFDPAAIEVVDAGQAKPAEALRDLRKNAEARIRFVERDGVKTATLISIKGPVKLPPEKLASYEEVEKLVAAGPAKASYLLVDSRPLPRVQEGTIPTAVNLPFTTSGFDKLAAEKLPADKATKIIFFCQGVTCTLSPNAQKRAEALGYTNTKVYREGWPEWTQRNVGVLAPAHYRDAWLARDIPNVLVDARPAAEALEGSIPGAVRIGPSEIGRALAGFPDRKLKPPVMVYDGGDGKAAFEVARAITKAGYPNVNVITGGYTAWNEAKNPIQIGKMASAVRYVPKLRPGQITVAEFQAIASKKPADTLVLDVRNADEAAGGMLPGAKLVPDDEILARLAEIPRDKRIVAHCSTGVRAEMTYHKLREKGYNVAFVKGDIEIDKAGNLKIVPN